MVLLTWLGVLEIVIPDLQNCVPLKLHVVAPAANRGEYHHAATTKDFFAKGIAETFQFNPIYESHINMQAKHIKIYADMVLATAPFLKGKPNS